MRYKIALLAVSAITVGLGAKAQAGSVTIQNTTDVVSYASGSSGGPTNYFSNGTSAVGSSIGPNFDTSSLAVTATAIGNGNYSIDLQYTTLFSGSESINGQAIYYPDIFLRTAQSGYSTAPFDYAISLGDEVSNGGLAAGVYSAKSYLTSQALWSGRSGDVYGGQYTNSTAYQPGQAGYLGYNPPVVLTAGTKVGNAAVTNGVSGNAYTVDVKITVMGALAAGIIDGSDIFWGTGDCANGSFLASIPDGVGGPGGAPLPEPSAMLLLAAGVGSLAFVRMAKKNAI